MALFALAVGKFTTWIGYCQCLDFLEELSSQKSADCMKTIILSHWALWPVVKKLLALLETK